MRAAWALSELSATAACGVCGWDGADMGDHGPGHGVLCQDKGHEGLPCWEDQGRDVGTWRGNRSVVSSTLWLLVADSYCNLF
jgi:hypothetical protein